MEKLERFLTYGLHYRENEGHFLKVCETNTKFDNMEKKTICKKKLQKKDNVEALCFPPRVVSYSEDPGWTRANALDLSNSNVMVLMQHSDTLKILSRGWNDFTRPRFEHTSSGHLWPRPQGIGVIVRHFNEGLQNEWVRI